MPTSKTHEPTHWPTLRTQLGAAIRHTRLKANLSQEDLAERSHLSQKTIYRAEWGKISLTIERLTDIATALNTTTAALLSIQDAPAPENIKWDGGRRPMTDQASSPPQAF